MATHRRSIVISIREGSIASTFHPSAKAAEAAALMTLGNNPPDREAAAQLLLEFVPAGAAVRTPLGDDVLWELAAA